MEWLGAANNSPAATDVTVGQVVNELIRNGWTKLQIQIKSDYPYVQLQDTQGSRRVVTIVGTDSDVVSPAALELIYQAAQETTRW